MTRVLVCGGRDFDNRDLLFAALDALHKQRGFVVLIEGEQRGADLMAKAWAEDRRVPVLPFKPDWDLYHLRAGSIRNQQMLDEGKPDFVVAFEGDVGTRDMIRRAENAGVEVLRVQTLFDVGVDPVAETDARSAKGRGLPRYGVTRGTRVSWR